MIVWKITKNHFHTSRSETILFLSGRTSSDDVQKILKALFYKDCLTLYEQLGTAKYTKPTDYGYNVMGNRNNTVLTIGHEPTFRAERCNVNRTDYSDF